VNRIVIDHAERARAGMFQNPNLLVFAIAFVGCVLATPAVTRLAGWLGAIDRPDQFRRVHKGAVPRLGGIGLAFGVALAALPFFLGIHASRETIVEAWTGPHAAVALAAAIVLVLGVLDDTRGLAPRTKLLVQAAAAAVLFFGNVRITSISVLGLPIHFSFPIPIPIPGGVGSYELDVLSLAVTLLWFLACMNIWNLIDGMDGLASGVGLLVSGTLMLVAIRMGHEGSAALAAALAGGLAGFLLYNWHPACIFLGDSGSLLIGLLIGVIGVRASMKGTTTISILIPILAMGLPISDTAMAIFRRWVRDLPLSSADRRHIHHLLIGLGLNPRQAAAMLYCFSGFLCGVVLLGVAINNPIQGEFLAVALGISGCLAFLLILTSRRDELASLIRDVRSRSSRRKQERLGSRLTWDAVQKIEISPDTDRIWEVLFEVAEQLGCDRLELEFDPPDGDRIHRLKTASTSSSQEAASSWFRLRFGSDGSLVLTGQHDSAGSVVDPDVAVRAFQRLGGLVRERLTTLALEIPRSAEEILCAAPAVVPPTPVVIPGPSAESLARPRLRWPLDVALAAFERRA
jgi:UDP-GlcNAc:undecaprenyl-phosphate GlcNAc-1-phosphate transferase